MTYGEAREMGYRVTSVKYQRGYVSRKTDTDEQTVYKAGGHRNGQLYFLAPCFKSTQYCYRMYISR